MTNYGTKYDEPPDPDPDLCEMCGDTKQWDSEKLACSCTVWDVNDK